VNISNKIRIKDVARKANVSVGTVDRVLHNRGEVSAHTRDLVNTIIEEMGYKPNAIASALAQKKKTRIAVLMPLGGDMNPFYDAYENGVAKATEELVDFGAQVELHHFDPILSNFKEVFNRLRESEPDAMVISPCELGEAEHALLQEVDSNKITWFGPNAINNGSEFILQQDSFKSGYVGARILSYGLTKETTVLVINIGRNELNDKLYLDRFAGFKQYLKDRNITEMSIRSIEVQGLQEADIKKTLTNAFLDYSFVRGLFITGSHAGKVARFIEEKKLGNIRLVGYDLTEENVQYLKKGHIDFLLSQNPEWQSYRAVMSTFEHHVLGKDFSTKKIPVDIITKDNVDEFLNND
jgi:LacI family transcriptional regulator